MKKYDKLELIEKVTSYYCKHECLMGIKGECMKDVCPIYEVREIVKDDLPSIGDKWLDAFLTPPEPDWVVASEEDMCYFCEKHFDVCSCYCEVCGDFYDEKGECDCDGGPGTDV